MSIQKLLPVITSILIILLVAFLRDKSRTAAAIFAVMPINMPLALWVVFGAGEYAPAELSAFLRNIFLGMITTIVWVSIVFLAIHFGAPLGFSILIAYFVWAALIFGMYWMGWLTMGK
jgi:hypothetical protein